MTFKIPDITWDVGHSFNLYVGLCDGATYWATGVKDRSITQPRVSLTTFSPPRKGGIFGMYISVDGSPHTVVRAYPNFDPNPGDPGRHVYNNTHAQAVLSVHLDGSTCSESLSERTCHFEPPEHVLRSSARTQTCVRGPGGLPACHAAESTRKDPRPEEKKRRRTKKHTFMYVYMVYASSYAPSGFRL